MDGNNDPEDASKEGKTRQTRHSIASDVPLQPKRRSSFLSLAIPEKTGDSHSSSASSSWRGSLTHLGLPTFTLTSPDGEGRKFSFGLGLRRHSHNVSFYWLCAFVCFWKF